LAEWYQKKTGLARAIRQAGEMLNLLLCGFAPAAGHYGSVAGL
jgi:hypothetical protein